MVPFVFPPKRNSLGKSFLLGGEYAPINIVALPSILTFFFAGNSIQIKYSYYVLNINYFKNEYK